jgi:hypothetical protein
MIAFRNFLKKRDRTLPPLKLSRPPMFVLIRGASEERIEADFDASGRKMTRLVVYTRSR